MKLNTTGCKRERAGSRALKSNKYMTKSGVYLIPEQRFFSWAIVESKEVKEMMVCRSEECDKGA
jgi:hypothetical protein